MQNSTTQTANAVGKFVLCLAEFPNEPDAKLRPALIFADRGNEVIAAPLTTHAPRNGFDVSLRSWWEAGLLEESVVRVEKVGPLPRCCIHRVIGQVVGADVGRVTSAVIRWSHYLTA